MKRTISLVLAGKQAEMFHKMLDETNMTVSELVRDALRDYYDKMFNHPAKYVLVREEKVTYDVEKSKP